jgi:hypothetical protein
MGKPYKPRELHVVVDTNVIYALGHDADVSKTEIQRTIKSHISYPDLKISWYVPDIVRAEREYQLKSKARELLPPIIKVERLLKRKFAVTEDDLNKAAIGILERQLASLSLQSLQLDHRRVSWKAVCEDAVNRRPPFSAEKEKGFRDAIIVQTFLQFAASSEEKHDKELFALVSNDDLVETAISGCISDRKNIRFSRTLGDLEGLIKTLLANVDEGFIEELKPQASKIFFEEGNSNCLYYKEQVEKKLRETFSSELTAIPKPAVPPPIVLRENGSWWIHHPNFYKKEGRNITWVSRVYCAAKAFGHHFQAPDPAVVEEAGNIYLRNKPEQSGWLDMLGAAALYLSKMKVEKKELMNGKTQFDVIWSSTLDDDRLLKNCKLEELKYAGAEWV